MFQNIPSAINNIITIISIYFNLHIIQLHLIIYSSNIKSSIMVTITFIHIGDAYTKFNSKRVNFLLF